MSVWEEFAPRTVSVQVQGREFHLREMTYARRNQVLEFARAQKRGHDDDWSPDATLAWVAGSLVDSATGEFVIPVICEAALEPMRAAPLSVIDPLWEAVSLLQGLRAPEGEEEVEVLKKN